MWPYQHTGYTVRVMCCMITSQVGLRARFGHLGDGDMERVSRTISLVV